LLLSEDLRKYRVTMQCHSCGYTQEKTMTEEALESFTLPSCPTCKTSIPMEMIKKVDLVDELSDLAEKTSATGKIIASNSEEGEALYAAFSGHAGILRYPLEI